MRPIEVGRWIMRVGGVKGLVGDYVRRDNFFRKARPHRGAIRGAVLDCGVAESIADDVVNVILVYAMRHIESFVQGTSFQDWLLELTPKVARDAAFWRLVGDCRDGMRARIARVTPRTDDIEPHFRAACLRLLGERQPWWSAKKFRTRALDVAERVASARIWKDRYWERAGCFDVALGDAVKLIFPPSLSANVALVSDAVDVAQLSGLFKLGDKVDGPGEAGGLAKGNSCCIWAEVIARNVANEVDFWEALGKDRPRILSYVSTAVPSAELVEPIYVAACMEARRTYRTASSAQFYLSFCAIIDRLSSKWVHSGNFGDRISGPYVAQRVVSADEQVADRTPPTAGECRSEAPTLLDKMVAVAQGIVGYRDQDTDLANQIAAEAVVDAKANLFKFKQDSNFDGWILAICENLALTWRDRRKKLSPLEDHELVDPERETRVRFTADTNRSLAKLPPEQRRLLRLKHQECLTDVELEKAMQLSQWKIRTLDKKANAAIRRSMDLDDKVDIRLGLGNASRLPDPSDFEADDIVNLGGLKERIADPDGPFRDILALRDQGKIFQSLNNDRKVCFWLCSQTDRARRQRVLVLSRPIGSGAAAPPEILLLWDAVETLKKGPELEFALRWLIAKLLSPDLSFDRWARRSGAESVNLAGMTLDGLKVALSRLAKLALGDQ